MFLSLLAFETDDLKSNGNTSSSAATEELHKLKFMKNTFNKTGVVRVRMFGKQ